MVFYDLKQKYGESIGAWFSIITNTAIDCNFVTRLNDVFQDYFIFGLKSNRVLYRLYEEDPEVKT